MTESIEEKVKRIIVENVGVDLSEVALEADFVNDLGADSLDTVELVAHELQRRLQGTHHEVRHLSPFLHELDDAQHKQGDAACIYASEPVVRELIRTEHDMDKLKRLH